MNKNNDEILQSTPSHLGKASSSASSVSSSSSVNSNQKNHYNSNNNNNTNNNHNNNNHSAHQNSRYKGNNYNNSGHYNKDFNQRSRNNNNNNNSNSKTNLNYNSNINRDNNSNNGHRQNHRNTYGFNNNQKNFSNSKRNDDNNSINSSRSNLNKLDISDSKGNRQERDNNSSKMKPNSQKPKEQNNNYNKKSNQNSKSYNNYNNNNNYNNYNHNHNYQFQSAPFQPASYHSNHGSNNNTNFNNQTNLNSKNFNNINNQQHGNHQHHHHNHNNHHHNNIQIPKQFNCIITAQNQKQHKFLIEKYNTKYNLISFILLRKNDEYLADYKYYFNDQSLYQKVDLFIEKRQLEPLREMFHSKEPEIFGNIINLEQNLTDFTNSYNCNIFVYTIRKCLEFESKRMSLPQKPNIVKVLDENNNEIFIEEEPAEDTFTLDLIQMLFDSKCCPSSFFLIDGEFPKRNVMHYAANYNCPMIARLILDSFIKNQHKNVRATRQTQDSNDIADICREALIDITEKICAEFNEGSQSLESFQVNSELVLIQLCLQTDFNGNTPIHLAAINDSHELIKLINPLCIRYSQFVYNEDGLNPFLLACRHSSVEFIKHLVEQQRQLTDTTDPFLENTRLDLLQCRDKINFKNCLHYACGRGCGNDALKTIKYLTNLAVNQSDTETKLNELIGAISPLIGSVLHAAASNLTRLSSLWYLLSLYPEHGILVNNESILNSLDFRDFTCVDCLFDAVMNLREMAPPNCKQLTNFYNELIGQKQAQVQSTDADFQILLKRCIYKLSIDFHASFFNLPRIKNQWQLLEFFRILVFMCKFYTEKRNLTFLDEPVTTSNTPRNTKTPDSECTYDKIYGQNFELFCINFFKKFIIGGNILPSIFTTPDLSDTHIDTNAKPKNGDKQNKTADKQNSQQTLKNPDESYVLNEIMLCFYDLVFFCSVARPECYSRRFRVKLATYLQIYLKNLGVYYVHKSNVNIAKLAILLTTPAAESVSISLSSKGTNESANDSLVDHFVYKNLNSEKPNCSDDDTESLIHEDNIKCIEQRAQLAEVRANCGRFIRETNIDGRQSAQSLANLCRTRCNEQMRSTVTNSRRRSALSKDYALFRLPVKYASVVNFLSYNLVDDLYGADFDVKSVMCTV